MEIMATVNNHNQKELRLYAPNEQQQQTANATTTTLNSNGARSPFQREVREWQRIDPDTGALLTGRLEADRWINGPLNKYGKKSSSSLSNSSNNSTTASQTTTATNTTSSINTHKPLANKVSLHAIVGSSSNVNSINNMTTAATTSSTPSPTLMATRTSWQQPTLYRQNSNNSKNVNATAHSHLMKSRVGDNNNLNCCSNSGAGGGNNSICRSSSGSNSSSDESRSDLRHLQQQQQYRLHVKQNDRLTPTHLPQSYQRVDLESFRHYNENTNNSNNNNNNINDTDDDGLRLSNRHLRRQQIPSETFISSLQRSRSISTDDLSTEWDVHGGHAEEPAEWRRVSKLRRSFQSSSSTQKNQTYGSPTTTRRPLDLPTNSVSVSKIRAELENGRRLNTVMRNNHVDLAALSNILNGNSEKETKSPLTNKRDTFLTAESLKEIRGKLKKLSDESLYKEDFIVSQQNNDTNPEVEHHIVNDQTKVKQSFATRKSPERYRVLTKTEESNNKHTTNSLESRVKYKDTNSVDWHTRRKSYGFEKMSPPEKAMLRMDASTDSGLGRSGELQNWSPTSEPSAANRTVVHFGETGNVSKQPLVQRRYRPQKSFEESENSHEEDSCVSKRHSIAVDESQYVRDNAARQTTQIHLNGFYEPGGFSKFVQQSTESTTTTTTDRGGGQQKRVEFSKTEVHFATESGRVNIVETDSKPPPTNNFRRRRSRSSSVGPLQSLVKSATTVSTTNSVAAVSNTSTVAMPVTLFGDDNMKKKTLASTTVAYRAPLIDSPEPTAPKDTGINVTVTVPSTHNTDAYAFTESSRSSYASTSGVDTTDCDTDEMTSLRGILKNKPAKPKPYVLGENIDKPDELWGVQLKPVAGNQTKSERAYKSESPTLIASLPQKSVAERIQELGSASSQTNGFSTKINVSLGSTSSTAKNWEDNDLPKSNVMSIKLHSPLATTEVQPPLKVVPPIAKPRTITIQESSAAKTHSATTVKQAPFQSSLPTKDSLKIVKEARGARQLRVHELSYFGVPVTSTSEDEKPKTKYATTSNFRSSPKRSLPLRKLSEESTLSMGMESEKQKQREQWQLENDKPDLLKHNPIEIKPAERTSLKKKAELDEEEEHLYENIANDITPMFKVKAATPPKEQYDRKMDLKRDFEILSEMNQNADQTLRELSDEAALKDRRRRSLQRRNSKPLETIDEKAIAERINDSCIAVKISRSTYASEARKTSRHSTPSPSGNRGGVSSRERSSSQSSVECCPRARSRSLSSEKEYDITKASKTSSRTPHMVKHKTSKPTQSRSSSLDSQRSSHSQYSSGDEPQQQRSSTSFRREDRSRTKTKRITSSVTASTRDKHRDEKTARPSSSNKHYHHGDSKHLSSTTPSSQHRERVECKHDNSPGSTATRHHSGNSSGLQRSTTVSGSGRRHKDDLRDSQRIKRSAASTTTARSTVERSDKQEKMSSKHTTRSLRDDERNSSQRSSSHRLERNDKDKDNEKTTRSSKGHSSRSTSHPHHDRATTIEKHAKETKTKSTTSTASATAHHENNTTSSKNPQQQHHQTHHNSKDGHKRQQKSKRDEDQQQHTEHVHGLKSAIMKTTTKLRDKSRSRKDKK